MDVPNIATLPQVAGTYHRGAPPLRPQKRRHFSCKARACGLRNAESIKHFPRGDPFFPGGRLATAKPRDGSMPRHGCSRFSGRPLSVLLLHAFSADAKLFDEAHLCSDSWSEQVHRMNGMF